MRFQNKVAMITGAAVGIGRAVALQIAEQGGKVLLADTNREKLEQVLLEIGAENGLACVCDVSDREAVENCVRNGIERFGKIDILVNNAAVWRCWSSFQETPAEDWEKFIDINVMGVVHCTKAVLDPMIERGWGRIINIGSVAGVYGNANMVHYSATKGAVIAMTRALAKEVADKGVLVNCVSPGSVSPSENPDIDSYVSSPLSFMNRTGTDRENANLICFLASDEASYISGQNIQIDGCRRKQ